MNNKIKIGTFVKNYPVNKLIYSTLNRDIVEKHSDSFKNKVVEFGWLVPIIIDHKGYVLEGHHRIEMAIKLGLKTLPSYIIDWVDTTNKDEYQKYVMTINNNNRKWSALDYLKSYKQTRKDYSYVFNKYTNSDGLFTV